MQNKSKVLVTGASGFLGKRIVRKLLEHDYSVRALVRSSSSIESLRLPGVEFHYADVTDAHALLPAFEGVDYVIHAAAGTSGSDEQIRHVTLEGTKNILEISRSQPLKKLVYISSCSVYGVAVYVDGQKIDENSPLERYPERRGMYSWSKLEAERIVTDFMARWKGPLVCLRPGTIYGAGGENYSPMIGFSKSDRLFVVIDKKDFILPLVYIDNLVDAIMLAMTSEKSSGRIYNVVDPEQIDKKTYMDTFIRKLHPGAVFLYFPYKIFAGIVALQENAFGLLKRKPVLSMYRLRSSQNPVVYDVTKIQEELGWQPVVKFVEAVGKIIDQDQHKELIAADDADRHR